MRALYATPNGKRYHASFYCEGLNAWHMAHSMDEQPPKVTMSEAARRGLTPCNTCHPTPLLKVVR